MVGAIAFVPEEHVDQTRRLLKPQLPPDMIEFERYYEATWMHDFFITFNNVVTRNLID